jgi:hypothetical protein
MAPHHLAEMRIRKSGSEGHRVRGCPHSRDGGQLGTKGQVLRTAHEKHDDRRVSLHGQPVPTPREFCLPAPSVRAKLRA